MRLFLSNEFLKGSTLLYTIVPQSESNLDDGSEIFMALQTWILSWRAHLD